MFFFDFIGLSVLTQFAHGAATGFGHTFGQKLLPWVVKSWNWLFRRGKTSPPAELPNDELLLRQVTPDELTAGIPEGYQLCRYEGESLVHTYLDHPPDRIADDESLWLVPTEPVLVSTDFSAGDASTTAEVAVEFIPDDGLSSLLTDGQDLNRGWLEGLIAGGLLGLVTSIGTHRAVAFIKGDAAATDGCRTHLNQAFRNRGLRCTSLRSAAVGAPPGTKESDPEAAGYTPPPEELAAALQGIRTRADWELFVASLRANGVPIDNSTSRRLDELRDGLLAKSVAPQQAVTNLGQLTVEAFERAGITHADLQRWQSISDRLGDVSPDDGDETALPVHSANAAVAMTARPSAWLAWDRYDVDRRQLRYTRQSVRHCRAACDQALSSLRDLPSLRQARELNEQLKLIEEMLSTTPPLKVQTASLRLDTATVKSLLKSLEQAVLTTEQLSKQTNQLFADVPASAAWQETFPACLRSASVLSQFVRDRRTVR